MQKHSSKGNKSSWKITNIENVENWINRMLYEKGLGRAFPREKR